MLLERLRSLIAGWRGSSTDDVHPDGTAQFKVRYHALRLLLAANNTALETMAEKEGAVRGGRIFGMNLVQ